MNLKTKLLNLSKLFIILICFYILKDKVNFIILATYLEINKFLILVSIIMFIFSQFLLGIRLKNVAKIYNEDLHMSSCIKYTFISKMYALLGMLSIFSDINKFYLLKKKIKNDKVIIKILLADRLIGIISILLIIFFAGILYLNKISIWAMIIFVFITLIILNKYSDNKILNLNLNYKFFLLSNFFSILTWLFLISSSAILIISSIDYSNKYLFGLTLSTGSLIVPLTPFGIGSSQLFTVYLFDFMKLNKHIGFLYSSFIHVFTIISILLISIPLNFISIFYKNK